VKFEIRQGARIMDIKFGFCEIIIARKYLGEEDNLEGFRGDQSIKWLDNIFHFKPSKLAEHTTSCFPSP